MKRTFALLLSVLLLGLLLTGCDRFTAAEQESRSPMFQPTPAQTDPAESSSLPNETPDSPSEADLPFPVFPEGNYLADPMFDTDEFLPEYDADPSFLQLESTFFLGVCATEDTIYFFHRPDESVRQSGTYLFFTDIASGVTMPLCSKPECSHTNGNCNAYLSSRGDVYGLQIYNGKIYWLANDDGFNLMCMNMDGTGHEIVTSLDPHIRAELNACTTVFIHRGYLYISAFEEDFIGGNEPMRFFTYATPIDSGETFTVFEKVIECFDGRYFIQPIGNNIYISVQAAVQLEDSSETTAHYESLYFYRWDAKTRKAECLYANDNVTNQFYPYTIDSFTTPFPVPGDGIYFDCCESGAYALGSTVVKLSFQTGEIEEVGAFPFDSYGPKFVKDYIVARAPSHVYFCDYDLNAIYQTEFPDTISLNNIIGGNSQYVFYLASGGKNIAAFPLDGGDMLILDDPRPATLAGLPVPNR